MNTLLADLVRNQTVTSLVNVLTRTTDTIAEEMARDLLRDPEFRTEMQQLMRAAFHQALLELREPPR